MEKSVLRDLEIEESLQNGDHCIRANHPERKQAATVTLNPDALPWEDQRNFAYSTVTTKMNQSQNTPVHISETNSAFLNGKGNSRTTTLSMNLNTFFKILIVHIYRLHLRHQLSEPTRTLRLMLYPVNSLIQHFLCKSQMLATVIIISEQLHGNLTNRKQKYKFSMEIQWTITDFCDN